MRVAVLGRVADTEAAHDWAGHDVLPRAGWTLDGNVAFLRELARAGRPVYLASRVCRANLADDRGALTMFGLELAALWRAGFHRVGPWLFPPDPFARALAADPIGVFERIRRRAASGDRRVPELAPTIAQLALVRPALGAEARALAADGVPYAEALRFAHRCVGSLDEDARAARPDLERVYQPKAGAELEPLVALFPDVIAFPALAPLGIGFFLETRVVPVHPLGVIAEPLFSDGGWMSPLEYFLHDVDHARFMVREELRSRGVELEDAYQPLEPGGAPTTLVDASRGLHRTILDGAGPGVAEARLGDRAVLQARGALAASLLRSRAQEPDRRAEAISLLLFEILHEKGFPLDGAVLRREVACDRHARKLRDKLARGFYGDGLIADAAAVALLDWARGWLEARA